MKRFLVLAAIMLPFAGEAKDTTLYDRVQARLERDPALARQIGHMAPQMKDVNWLVGRWDIAATVDGRAGTDKGSSSVTPVLGGVWLEMRDTYPMGNQDITYLTYNLVTRRWTSTTIDQAGDAVTATSAGMDKDSFIFTGDVTVMGEKATLRQTMTRQGCCAYLLVNEERMPSGAWKLLDTYRYTRH